MRGSKKVDRIELEPGVTFTRSALEREVRKGNGWLEKHPGARRVDTNTSRSDLAVWVDRCAAALNPKVDVSRVETLAEAKAWDAEKSRWVNRGLSDADAAAKAWVKANG